MVVVMMMMMMMMMMMCVYVCARARMLQLFFAAVSIFDMSVPVQMHACQMHVYVLMHVNVQSLSHPSINVRKTAKETCMGVCVCICVYSLCVSCIPEAGN